ncbi:MAG TPA: hypothetical protein VIT42_18010 [Microlunatus sp.]
MGRTNFDIEVIRRDRRKTEREASTSPGVGWSALRSAGNPFLALAGTGWDGDLDALRTSD